MAVHRLNITVSPETLAILNTLQACTGASRSAVIRLAVEAYTQAPVIAALSTVQPPRPHHSLHHSVR